MAAETAPPDGGGSEREQKEYAAGTPAPATALYETVNLFGRRTGHRVLVRQGDALPALPRGFAWVAAENEA